MTDSIVTPENTKKIAEWMGYDSRTITNFFGTHIIIKTKYGGVCDYNPITNAEQSREIEKKLLDLCWKIEKFSVCNYQATSRETGNSLLAETLELVIYEVALFEVGK